MSLSTRTPFTSQDLASEKATWSGTAGCSAGNHAAGFRPGFLDRETGSVYLSAFADGRPAPVHLLDGLPQHLVIARAPGGRVRAVKASVVSGFLRDLRFYTREEALRAMEEEEMPLAA